MPSGKGVALPVVRSTVKPPVPGALIGQLIAGGAAGVVLDDWSVVTATRARTTTTAAATARAPTLRFLSFRS